MMSGIPEHSIDKGWAWIILVSSFVLNILSLSVLFSSGIFLVVFMEDLNATVVEAAWIPSLATATLLGSGLAAGYLVEKFGFRIVLISGSIITTLGYICSMFAESIYTLYGTFGLMIGCGCGFTYLPSLTMLGFYFKKRKYFAMAMSSIGAGLASFIFPPFIYFIIEQYGWRGSLLILAGINSNMIVCGAVARPIKSSLKQENRLNSNQCQTTLFKDIYLYITIFQLFFFHGYYIFIIMFNKFLIVKDINMEENSYLTAMFGLGNIIGRFIVTIIGLSPKYIKLVNLQLTNAATFIHGILIFCCIYPKSAITFAILSLFIGLFYGIKAALVFAVSLELFEIKYTNLVIGYSLCISGLSVVIGPSLAGILISWTNSMDSSMILSAIFITISGFLTLAMTIKLHKRRTTIMKYPHKETIPLK